MPETVWRVYTPTHFAYAADILSASESDFIEEAINRSKPARASGAWDPWIKSPFDFPLPVGANYGARFLPPGYPRNAFYAAYAAATAVYETAFRFWQMRKASTAELSSRWEERRIFSVSFDAEGALDLRDHPEAREIMTRTDYSLSYDWAWKNQDKPSILYPSARAPKRGGCVCVYDIHKLGQQSLYMNTLAYALGEATVVVKSTMNGLPVQIAVDSLV